MTPPRREMVELAAFAAQHGCRGSAANRLVAEGRDTGKYSSCGDLAHACLYACGCRADWLNRDEHHGWRSGVNLSRLWHLWQRDERGKYIVRLPWVLPGDLLLLDGDTQRAHVAVILSLSDDRSRLRTADYGQPGGALRDSPLIRTAAGTMIVRGRRWTHHASLRDVPWSEPPQTVGAWAESRGAPELAELWRREGLLADRLLTAYDMSRMEAER